MKCTLRSHFFAQLLCIVGCCSFAIIVSPAFANDAVAKQVAEAEQVDAEAKVTEAESEDDEERDLTKELIQAIGKREADTVKDLLSDGADINAADERGLTPYKAAQMLGDKKMAKMLKVLGANTEVKFDPIEFVDRSLKRVDTKDKPGAAVLIARGKEVIYSGAVGNASIEHSVPVTLDTKFRIGSVSKQFTASAILKLQEEGKLSIEDKLSKYVEDFPRGDEVTLHHMLTHTSGLKNYTDASFFETAASKVEIPEMIEQFKEAGFDSDPGEKFAYCNTGYFLLCHIVEEVSGQSFGEYLNEQFFEPLEMSNTGIHDSSGIYKHEATGYSMVDDEVTKALDWDMSRARGAGDIYSTVGDLHKWNTAVFSGKVLSEESLQAAHRVRVELNETSEQASSDEDRTSNAFEMPYGYGWMIDTHRGLKRIWHSGGLNGFVSQLAYYPDQQVTVVAMHNAFPSITPLSPGIVCEKVAETFLWQEMETRPEFEVDKSIDSKTYDEYVGRYDYVRAVLTVSKEGDKLMAQLTGQPKFEIFPYAKDKFFWKVVDAQAYFQRDDDGKVHGVRHSQGISKFFAGRIVERTVIELNEEQLDRFVGEWNYGLSRLKIRRDGTQLYAKMTGQPEYEVFPEAENKVFWKVVNAQLEVDITDDGTVESGFHSQGGQTSKVTKL